MIKMVHRMFFFGFIISGAVTFLPEEEEIRQCSVNDEDNWVSYMENCFINTAVVDSAIEAHESICQQLRLLNACCRKGVNHREELKNALLEAVVQTQQKFCTNRKSMFSTNRSTNPWNCMQELATIFNVCLFNFTRSVEKPFETFSFVECRHFYSMQHCISKEILHCRSRPLLDIFTNFHRNVLSKTPCTRSENANEPA